MRMADSGSVDPPGATCSPQKSPLQHMRQELLPKGAAPRKAIPVVQASDTTPEQFYEKYIALLTLLGPLLSRRARPMPELMCIMMLAQEGGDASTKHFINLCIQINVYICICINNKKAYFL